MSISEYEEKFAKLSGATQDMFMQCFAKNVKREDNPDRIGMTGDYRYSVHDASSGTYYYATRTVNILFEQGFVEVNTSGFVVPTQELQAYLESL